MAFNDPRTMSRPQLMMWLKSFLRTTNKIALKDIIEQWGLQGKVEGFSFDNYINDETRVQFKSTKTRFMKVYYEEIYKMFDGDKIDATDIGYIILFGKYIDYEDNTLKNEDGSYLSMENIKIVLKMSDSTVKRFLKRMLNSQIIFKKPDETDKYKRRNKYFINPHVIFKGKYIDKKIKSWLDKLRKEAKEIKTNTDSKNDVLSVLDHLADEMDYSDMSEEEVDSMSEELYSLVV